MSVEESIFALIGERYLDTQHEAQYIAGLEKELQRRGVVGARRVLYEYVAASSLWWNVFWWEWLSLDERDIKAGWKNNLALFSVSGIFVAVLFQPLSGLLAVVALHILTLWIGLRLREGSVKCQ